VSRPIYPPSLNPARDQPKEEDGQMILYRNLGNGRFQDISEHGGSGLLLPRCSRGAAFGDIFHTGQIDIAVNNLNGYPTLLRNQSHSQNSCLLIKLVGTGANRAAIGPKAIVASN